MLRARKIAVGEQLVCTNFHVAGRGCFIEGNKYKVHSFKPQIGHVTMLCEAGAEHIMSYRDIGHYFHIRIEIIRKTPKWL